MLRGYTITCGLLTETCLGSLNANQHRDPLKMLRLEVGDVWLRQVCVCVNPKKHQVFERAEAGKQGEAAENTEDF